MQKNHIIISIFLLNVHISIQDEARGWIPSDIGSSYFAQLYSTSLNNKLSDFKSALDGIQERVSESADSLSPSTNIKNQLHNLQQGFSQIKEKISSYDIPFRAPKLSTSSLKNQLSRLKDGLTDIKEKISSATPKKISVPKVPKLANPLKNIREKLSQSVPKLSNPLKNLKDKLSGISEKFSSTRPSKTIQSSNSKQVSTKLAKITKSVTKNFINGLRNSFSRNSATRKVAKLFNRFGGWSKLRNVLQTIFVKIQNRQRIVPPSLNTLRRQGTIDSAGLVLDIFTVVASGVSMAMQSNHQTDIQSQLPALFSKTSSYFNKLTAVDAKVNGNSLSSVCTIYETIADLTCSPPCTANSQASTLVALGSPSC